MFKMPAASRVAVAAAPAATHACRPMNTAVAGLLTMAVIAMPPCFAQASASARTSPEATLGTATRDGKPVAYIPTMTGERFVSMLHRQEPLAMLDREKAYSYLDGLRDASHGTVWCDVNQLKTPDLAYDLAEEISKAPAAQRSLNASTLLLAILNRKFPCAGAKGR